MTTAMTTMLKRTAIKTAHPFFGGRGVGVRVFVGLFVVFGAFIQTIGEIERCPISGMF